jgi:hypothetical protein
MSGYLREVGHRPDRPARDPMGKAALFSDGRDVDFAEQEASPAADTRGPGTVVIECSACGQSTRVSYVGFVIDSLPFSIWLPPLPALWFNRKMTCPACTEFTWVRAHWLN